MDYFMLIQKSVDYIENNLDKSFQINDLARSAYCSDAHFSRVFRAIVGVSAMEYVRNRRLSLASRELFLTKQKILDIALKYGYETPEAFAKAFKRFHGISPIICRKSGTTKFYERSFPLVIKEKVLKGDINMNSFGSPLQQILDDLDKNSASLYLCFNAGSERFAISALEVSELTWTKYLFVNTENKLYLSQRGHNLPVLLINEAVAFDDIIEGKQNILYCAPKQKANINYSTENGFFGLVIDGNPELKLVTSLTPAKNTKWSFVTEIGKFEDEELPIFKAEDLKKSMSHQLTDNFEKSNTMPSFKQANENDLQKRLEFEAYKAELLARNASIEAVGGMSMHKGTMVVAYELHQHAKEIAKIASELRGRIC